MTTLARAAILFVAFEHLLFLVLEMFLWTKPFGRRTFGLTKEKAEDTKTLAANQGLYNGFVAAGLVWGAMHHDGEIAVFFLSCVVIAGIFGGLTVKRSIFFIQAVPAAIALALVLFAS